MKKIQTHQVKLADNMSAKVHMTFSDDGFLVLLAVPVIPRCKYDILEAINKVVQDKEKSEQIIEIIDKEFPLVLSEYRLEGCNTYTT